MIGRRFGCALYIAFMDILALCLRLHFTFAFLPLFSICSAVLLLCDIYLQVYLARRTVMKMTK